MRKILIATVAAIGVAVAAVAPASAHWHGGGFGGRGGLGLGLGLFGSLLGDGGYPYAAAPYAVAPAYTYGGCDGAAYGGCGGAAYSYGYTTCGTCAPTVGVPAYTYPYTYGTPFFFGRGFRGGFHRH